MRIGNNMLAAAAVAGALFCAAPAQATYVMEFSQVGSNVVATGSGSFNLTGLTEVVGSPWTNVGWLVSGAYDIIGSGSIYAWGDAIGPASFAGNSGPASSNTGELVGIDPGFDPPNGAWLYLPTDYVSGSDISSSSTWDNSTIAGLGLTPGTYTWTWGTGANADSFSILVDSVPEPASFAMLATGLVGLGMAGRRRRVAA